MLVKDKTLPRLDKNPLTTYGYVTYMAQVKRNLRKVFTL